MTPKERARLEGFFDGLMGRPFRPRLSWDAQCDLAYDEAWQRGRNVLRRPRRKRPKPQVSPNVQEWKL